MICKDIWSDGLELVAEAIYLKADTGIQSSLLDYHYLSSNIELVF